MMKKLFLYGLFLCLGWLLVIVAEPILAQVPEQPALLVQVEQPLMEQGRIYYQQGDWERAIATWQTALSHPPEPAQQATIWTYLGLAHQKQGNLTAAATALENSRQLLAPLPTHIRTPIQAQTLNAQGQLAFTQGQPDVAFTYWQQATQLYQTLNYPTGVTGSLINQARALEMGGHYRRACSTVLTAIGLENTSCDFSDSGTMPPVIAAFETALEAESDAALPLLGINSLGNILRLSGHLSQAQQLLEMGVKFAQPSAQPSAPSDTLATILLNLGKVHQAQYQQALFRYEQTQQATDQAAAIDFAALALAHYQTAQQRHATDLPSIQTTAQILDLLTHLQTSSLPVTFLNTFQPSLATQIQAQMVTIQQLPLDRFSPSRIIVDSQVALAQNLLTLWQSSSAKLGLERALPQALSLLNRAYQQAVALDDITAQSQVLGTLGHLYEIDGQPEQATLATQKALTLAQSLQAFHLSYQWQWQLGRLADPQQALAYYKAAVTSLNYVRQDLRAVETDIRFSLRDNVEPLYRELVSLLLKTPNGITPSQDNLKQAIQEIDALQLARLEDFLSCNLTQQVALNASQTDPTAAILYPIILPDQLAVVVQLPQSQDLQFYRTQVPATDTTQTLDSLRQQLERPFILPNFFDQAQRVYDWLIRPIEPALIEQSIETLVFVSDGALRNVPMAILHDGEQFLIENYAVALSPSLRLPASQPLSQLGANTLAFGLSETRSDFPHHQGFAPLQNVETELNSIQAQVPSKNLLNQRFTSRNLQTLIDQESAPILHLATHGQFSSAPSDTFLLAWDRRISLDDLNQLLTRRQDQSAIELLVLSACQTATGDSRATLGLAGVAIQSGARSTIASLWNVNDVATSELMKQLYQALSDPALSRAQALRQAQLALLNTRGFRPPFYWSSFVLVGNWR